jgi:hypothetical protein
VAIATTPRSQALHLSLVLGGQLRDADGLRLGKVDDLIVRLGSDDYPPVTSALATIAGRAVRPEKAEHLRLHLQRPGMHNDTVRNTDVVQVILNFGTMPLPSCESRSTSMGCGGG